MDWNVPVSAALIPAKARSAIMAMTWARKNSSATPSVAAYVRVKLNVEGSLMQQ